MSCHAGASTRRSPSPPRRRRSPPPPPRAAAAPRLLAQIDARGELRRRILSVLAAERVPGRPRRPAIVAAVPAGRRRVRTSPVPLRRPTRGGAAVYGRLATSRVRRAQRRVLGRRGAPPSSSAPPRQLRPTVTSRRHHGRPGLATRAVTWAGLSAFFPRFFKLLFFFFKT